VNLCGLVENDDANFSECKRMKLGSGVFRNLEGAGIHFRCTVSKVLKY